MNDFDTRELFDRYTTRKPPAWDQINMLPGWMCDGREYQEAIAALPVRRVRLTMLKPWEVSSPTKAETMEFILERKDIYYYANSEGYSYPRYMAIIPDGLLLYADLPKRLQAT